MYADIQASERRQTSRAGTAFSMSQGKLPGGKRLASTVSSAMDRSGSLARRMLQRLPGGDFVQEQIDGIEQRLLLELKQRLDRVGPAGQSGTSVSVVAVSVQGGDAAGRIGPHAPGQLMRELLAASAEQDREHAESAYYVSLLKDLVPDQARILAALSDGSTYPMINVMAASRLGVIWHPVVECVSSVGRNAGVLWPDMTHGYVFRLRSLNLVETGPEDYTQTTKYEMLETETIVRNALDQIKKSGQRSQVARRVLKISDLGTRLWAACRISED